jgi:N-acetylglucosaminyldiphosphoundecaprenol N-acetyl-beta-D-mannosaminyltransferase
MRDEFLGIELDQLSMDESIKRSIQLVYQRNTQHVVLNAAKVVMASSSPEFLNILNKCDLVNADGMAVVWAARLLGIKVPERVAGVDFMMRLAEVAANKKLSVYLLGGTSSVVRDTKAYFESIGVKVVGARDGYWEKSAESRVVSTIHNLAPDILFLAIPSPQKEYFLHNNLIELNCGLAVGVGGSFDIVAGVTKRAPRWMQSAGLEWLFRLLQEPRRMFKRYIVGNLKFIYLVIREIALRFSLESKNS